MTRITNADQVLLLLRAQLSRAEKAKRRSANQAKGAATSSQTAVERLRAVAADQNISDSDLSRALVSALLVEDFGEEAINQPRFQDLITQVTQTLVNDESANALLQQAMNNLGRKK